MVCLFANILEFMKLLVIYFVLSVIKKNVSVIFILFDSVYKFGIS